LQNDVISENICLVATDFGISNVYLMGVIEVLEDSPELLAQFNLPEGDSPVNAKAFRYSNESKDEYTMWK
jgi:hypothetical protein